MIARFRGFFAGTRAATVFLTRFPVACATQSLEAQRWTAAHFPLVGGLLGLLGCGVWLFASGLPTTVRAWLVIVVLLLSTGAFHEDGLADTADAMGGAFTRERLMIILKDSRVGSFGAVALVAGLSLRSAILAELLAQVPSAIIAAQSVSRFFPVVLMRCMPYVTASEDARSQNVVSVENLPLATAAVWALGFCWIAQRLYAISLSNWLTAVGLSTLAVGILGYRFQRRAGGLTGDFLGATQQICEIVFLLGLLIRRG